MASTARRRRTALPGDAGHTTNCSDPGFRSVTNEASRHGRDEFFEGFPPRWAPRGEKSRTYLVMCCCVLRMTYFFALTLAFGFAVLAVLVALTTLAAAAFFGAAFFATLFTATFFTADFLAAAGFFAADFLAAGFLAAGFLAAGFLAAAFLAAGFFAADFLAVAIVRLSSSSVGSGCPVKA